MARFPGGEKIAMATVILAAAIQVTSGQSTQSGEPGQRRAPALRPAVMGPHAGVSTGHPLTSPPRSRFC